MKRHNWAKEKAPKKGTRLRKLYERSIVFWRRQQVARQSANTKKVNKFRAKRDKEQRENDLRLIRRTEARVEKQIEAEEFQARSLAQLKRQYGRRWMGAYKLIMPLFIEMQMKYVLGQKFTTERRKYESLRALAGELLTAKENRILDEHLQMNLFEETESWDPYWKHYDHSKADLEQAYDQVI